MKEILFRLLMGLIGFIVIYLLGSFYSATFNINNWNEAIRFVVSLFGGLSFFALATYPNYNFKNK